MNGAPSGDNVCIRISTTLTSDTLSISSTTRSSPPIYLTLRLKLINSSTPFTIDRCCGFLDSHQFLYGSYFDLTSLSTGDHLRTLKVMCLRAPHMSISDPERQLITLYPNILSPEISIRIGNGVSPFYDDHTSDGRDPKPYLAVLATQIWTLQVGERYEIGLKDIDGEMPAYIWWCSEGTLEDVKEKLGRNGSVVPVNGLNMSESHANKSAASPRIEMEGKPILTVVE